MSQPSSERLTTRIIHPHDPTPSTEDIFSSALETLFLDDTQQSHGVPGQSIIYRSPRFGDVYLHIPVHPDEDGGRLLFAHYLWNAGVLCAEGVERGSCDDEGEVGQSGGGDGRDVVGLGVRGKGRGEEGNGATTEDDCEMVVWDKRFWDMRGMDVLELGAATALPSLLATLSNAHTVTTTDHPSSPAITMNAIQANFTINVVERANSNSTTTSSSSLPSLPSSSSSATTTINTNTGNNNNDDDGEDHDNTGQGKEQDGRQGDKDKDKDNDKDKYKYTTTHTPKLNHPPINTNTTVSIHGYTWGTKTFYAPGEQKFVGKKKKQPSPSPSPSPSPTQPELRSFDRIIIADCLWMAGQHGNLVRSVLFYLKEGGMHGDREDDDGGDGGGGGDSSSISKNGIAHVPCALVMAGFHTGRDIVRDFIELATGDPMGVGENSEGAGGGGEGEGGRGQDDDDADVRGKLKAAQIFEVDVYGRKREWKPVRPEETKEQSKRWCMCAILVRR